MYVWFLLILISPMFFTPSVNMAQEKGKADQEASFPAEVSGWKWDGKENHYNRKTIFDYINGAGELYIAYNFNGVKVRRYEKGNQPPITAEVYDMGTSEDAFGVFSFERQDEEAGIGQGSEFGGGLLRFWKGKFFVSVFAEGQGKEAEAATLDIGKAIANSIKSTGPIPKLLGVLPNGKTGLLEKSTRYFHSHILLNQRFFVANQNILNLNSKTEDGSSASTRRASRKSISLSSGTPKKAKRPRPCRNSKELTCPKSGPKPPSRPKIKNGRPPGSGRVLF